MAQREEYVRGRIEQVHGERSTRRSTKRESEPPLSNCLIVKILIAGSVLLLLPLYLSTSRPLQARSRSAMSGLLRAYNSALSVPSSFLA